MLRSYFNTDAGWRYYRNTWAVLTAAVFAVGAGCSLATPVHAAVSPAVKAVDAPPLKGYLGEVLFADSNGKIVRVIGIAQTDKVGECAETIANALLQHESEIATSVKSGMTLYAECFELATSRVVLTIAPKDLQKDETGDPRLTPHQAEQPRTGA